MLIIKMKRRTKQTNKIKQQKKKTHNNARSTYMYTI